MATTVSVCSWTSALLLLAAPALAQSQGGTGVGGALSQVQAGYASVEAAINEQWRGDLGRYTKYGIGLAGVGAALFMAKEAVYGTEGKITVSQGGTVQVTGSGGGTDSDDDTAVATSTATATATQ